MPSAILSSKGWIVIPVELRNKYKLRAGDELQIVDYGGILAVVPKLKDPIKSSLGLLKSSKSLCAALLAERSKERKRGK